MCRMKSIVTAGIALSSQTDGRKEAESQALVDADHLLCAGVVIKMVSILLRIVQIHVAEKMENMLRG